MHKRSVIATLEMCNDVPVEEIKATLLAFGRRFTSLQLRIQQVHVSPIKRLKCAQPENQKPKKTARKKAA